VRLNVFPRKADHKPCVRGSRHERIRSDALEAFAHEESADASSAVTRDYIFFYLDFRSFTSDRPRSIRLTLRISGRWADSRSFSSAFSVIQSKSPRNKLISCRGSVLRALARVVELSRFTPTFVPGAACPSPATAATLHRAAASSIPSCRRADTLVRSSDRTAPSE
jgi:hypothetical protein